jgi:hypothetical protein
VFNGDEFENIELKPKDSKGKTSLGDIRDVDNNRTDLTETQRNFDNLNINKAEMSEGGDILRELVKNKDLMKGRHGGLPKFSSMDSEMSEASTLMSTGSEVDGGERKKSRINHHTIKQGDTSDVETETPGVSGEVFLTGFFFKSNCHTCSCTCTLDCKLSAGGATTGGSTTCNFNRHSAGATSCNGTTYNNKHLR